MTSGILAGTLIKTGAAEKIAEVIVQKLGEKRALIAVAAATMVICAVGVFVDISVITVAPIALAIGKKAGYNKASLLLAMIGGGKAGNIISPNPNTIAVSEAFQVDLTSLMIKNIIPAVCALIVTVIIATILSKKAGTMVSDQDLEKHADNKKLPTFIQAFAGPLTVIILLALRPIFSIVIDPLIALPLGGLVCAIACGSLVQFREFAEFGLSKVAGVSILLIGTGTIAGIIKASALQYDVISLLEMMKMPGIYSCTDCRYSDGRSYCIYYSRFDHCVSDFCTNTVKRRNSGYFRRSYDSCRFNSNRFSAAWFFFPRDRWFCRNEY